MSLLIKGMEFPEIGEYKVFVFDDKATKRRKIMINKSYIDKHGMRVGNYSMYDFEEVVEPHGRLIDADELIAKLRYYYPSITFGKYNISLKDVVNEVESMIKTAPTIIEAEDNNGR